MTDTGLQSGTGLQDSTLQAPARALGAPEASSGLLS
jgi:hypothetical protein